MDLKKFFFFLNKRRTFQPTKIALDPTLRLPFSFSFFFYFFFSFFVVINDPTTEDRVSSTFLYTFENSFVAVCIENLVSRELEKEPSKKIGA